MPVVSMPPVAEHASLSTSLAQLRAIGEHFAAFVEGQIRELAARRAELSSCEQELIAARDRAHAAERQSGERSRELAQLKAGWEELTAEVEKMRDECSRRDEERLTMASELETVLDHAANLAQTEARERRAFAEARASYEAELSLLRRSLAAQPEITAQDNTPDSAPDSAGNHRIAQSTSDPVLDSIVAQFANLRKSAAKRGAANDLARQEVA